MNRRWHPLLLRVSRVLELVNAVARRAYRAGVLRTHRARVPVISVGNIAVGGTGKTPLVMALARILLDAGARPAVLTRGYRRRSRAPVLIHRRPDVGWELVGDEPALLARALPELAIVVDADRVRGAATAVERACATHLLLDDGFQHWRLARDLDIVAVNAADPLCEWISPRREHPRALARASAIVVTGTVRRPELGIPRLRQHAPTCPVIVADVVPTVLHMRGERAMPETLAGRGVLAFAGIAAPGRFAATLARLGADPVRLVGFPDHHAFATSEIERILADAAADGLLAVTTAKDAVRLSPELRERVAWLEVALAAPAGDLEALLRPLLAGIESTT